MRERERSNNHQVLLVVVVMVLFYVTFVITSRWDAQNDADYARFANCEASAACRSTRSVSR